MSLNDVFENTNLDKVTVEEMKVGKEVFVNVAGGSYFGIIEDFTSVGLGNLGAVIRDKTGKIRRVHHDWIYHHPSIIDRTNEFYSFAGEVILAPTFDGKTEKGIYVFCQTDADQFKIMSFSSSSYPNRYSGITIDGQVKLYNNDNKIWFTKDQIKDVMGGIFNKAEFTGKTLEEYFNQ